MSGGTPNPNIELVRCPIDAELAAHLIAFWEGVFGEPFARFSHVLLGGESHANEDTLHLVRAGDDLASTCRLTICRADRRLGLLGEVATGGAQRGRGLAVRVCEQARDHFAAQGGRALFLATSNPSARRLYERLGWRPLPNADAMVWLAPGESPATLTPMTRLGDAFGLVPGSPALRAPMVPCITRDHPWFLLDANARVFSTRFVRQPSCEGLYGRYDDLATSRRGEWFAALASPGHVLGLASAVPASNNETWQLDAFAEPERTDVSSALLAAVQSAAHSRGATSCFVDVAERDRDKRAWLESLGFEPSGPGSRSQLSVDAVATDRLSRRA